MLAQKRSGQPARNDRKLVVDRYASRKKPAHEGPPSAHPCARRSCYYTQQPHPRQNTDSSPVASSRFLLAQRRTGCTTTTPYPCVVEYALTSALDPPSTIPRPEAATLGFDARGGTTWHARDCRAVAPQQRNSAGRVITPITTAAVKQHHRHRGFNRRRVNAKDTGKNRYTPPLAGY